MTVEADLRIRREAIVREHGVAHDPLTVTGPIATVLNHPVTIGDALVRKLRRAG